MPHRPQDIDCPSGVLTETTLNIDLKAQGKWPNAPLALVLAQVRFNPTPGFELQELLARIRERSGAIYPHLSELQQVGVFIGGGGVSPPTPHVNAGYDLRSDTFDCCIRLQAGALTYTTTAYHDFPTFNREWRALLDVLCEPGPVAAARLGVRYIDFVIPSKGHVPEDYFRCGISRSPDVLGEQAPIAFSLFDYPRDNDGHLRIQVGRGFGRPGLPADVGDLLEPPPFLLAKYRGGQSAVLDMDRWVPKNEQMAPVALEEAFAILRDDIATSFRRIISPLATDEWQQVPTGGA